MWGWEGLDGRPRWGGDRVPPSKEPGDQDAGDHQGPPICIKLRKEEVKRSKGEPASGDRIEREKILDLSPKGASYGQYSTCK